MYKGQIEEADNEEEEGPNPIAMVDGVEVPYKEFQFEPGLVGTDGSAAHPRWEKIRAAGAAAYQVGATGIRRVVRWSLPKEFPQTAAASEVFAFMLAVYKAPQAGQVQVLVDCLAIVNCFMNRFMAERPQAKFGGGGYGRTP